MFDTISIGSATLDIFLKSKQFEVFKNSASQSELGVPYGGKVDIDDFALQSGGGASNTAVAFARLGLHAGLIAEVGKDLPAQLIKQELEQEKVDQSLLVEEKDEKTGVSALLIGEDGDRAALTARGAAKMLTVEDVPFTKLIANWIHMSSLGNVKLTQAIAKHCHKQRIRFSWNPGGAEFKAMEEAHLYPTDIYPDVFCVNEEEAKRIVKAGYELETTGTTVLITNADKGGRYFENGKWHTFEAKKTKTVQATGAGDAFIAGFVAALLHERRTEEAIEWGKANAASVVQFMGAKTGLRKDLDSLKS